MSESLGEREMLWEHELQARVLTVFWVLPNFHKCFYNLIGTQRICFLFPLEITASHIIKIIKTYILFACANTTSTACASSVFLSSYRNMVLNQSAHIFALGYFLMNIINKALHIPGTAKSHYFKLCKEDQSNLRLQGFEIAEGKLLKWKLHPRERDWQEFQIAGRLARQS